MGFDDGFDPAKSRANKEKHGIDFIESRAIWLDDQRVELTAKMKDGEERKATVGKIREKLFVAIWTLRNGMRFISVRRAEGTPFERAYNENQD